MIRPALLVNDCFYPVFNTHKRRQSHSPMFAHEHKNALFTQDHSGLRIIAEIQCQDKVLYELKQKVITC